MYIIIKMPDNLSEMKKYFAYLFKRRITYMKEDQIMTTTIAQSIINDPNFDKGGSICSNPNYDDSYNEKVWYFHKNGSWLELETRDPINLLNFKNTKIMLISDLYKIR